MTDSFLNLHYFFPLQNKIENIYFLIHRVGNKYLPSAQTMVPHNLGHPADEIPRVYRRLAAEAILSPSWSCLFFLAPFPAAASTKEMKLKKLFGSTRKSTKLVHN